MNSISVHSPIAVLMIRPHNFGFNEQTEVSNLFQNRIPNTGNTNISTQALSEFDNFSKALMNAGVDVHILPDDDTKKLPDSIFPNNWIGILPNRNIYLYPMEAINRRAERNRAIINDIVNNFNILKTIDLTITEDKGLFLEGTGSIIFDHHNQQAIACRSSRTSEQVLTDHCKELKYDPILFNATDKNGTPIYHTNVTLSISDSFSVICMDSVDVNDKPILKAALSNNGKSIIEITHEQMGEFCGNILEIQRFEKRNCLAMSTRAFKAFTQSQLNTIEQHCDIVHEDLTIIETVGGGSARCMLAGIHVDRKHDH